MVTQSVGNCEIARQGKKLYIHEKSVPQNEALPGNNHRSIRTAFPAPVHKTNRTSKKVLVLSYVEIGTRTEWESGLVYTLRK